MSKVHLLNHKPSIARNTNSLYNVLMGKENWNLVNFICVNCGTTVKGFPSRKIKYCTECSIDRKVRVTCLYCKSVTLQEPSRNAKYCNRKCWQKGQLGKKYPPEFGRKVSTTKLSRPAKNDGAGRKRANTYLYPVAQPCEECGATQKIDRHHIDKDPKNNERSNIRFLCKLHHQQLHKNWLDRWGKR